MTRLLFLATVHFMNAADSKTLDTYKTLLLLSEIDRELDISQRELSRRLGIAVGLVNSYLKNLVSKGYIRVKNFPRNRYGYLLTPQGISEKSRLAYQHLSYFTSLYTLARQDYLELFRRLEASGVRQVVFCGVDEVAEIAYLSLQETGIELVSVMDGEGCAGEFMGKQVRVLTGDIDPAGPPIVVTSLKRREALYASLLQAGIPEANIYGVGVQAE